LDIVVVAEIADGWHINAHQPSSDMLIPTILSVEAPPGFEIGEIGYPEPEKLMLRFAGETPIEVYTGEARFDVPVTIGGAFTQEGSSFQAKLHYQACDDTRCLRPADVERTFVVKRPADAASARRATSNVAPVDRWLADFGLLSTLLLVAIMGLGLNLTPCVYPLISVTIAYFGGQARAERGRGILLSSAYALGIALTFSLLGVSAALSGSLFGQALQRSETLLVIAALMVLLAFSCFGFYTIQAPHWLLQKAGRSGQGVVGALVMGLTMGVVAAPCVGPIVAGLLLAVGARGDALLGFLLFFALALGLGAPYVVLGAAAGSLQNLPRSGEWLVWVEHVFGFVLLGLALYFVSPLLPPRAIAWTAATLLVAAGVILGFVDRNGERLPRFTIVKRAVGIAALAAAALVITPREPATAIAWETFSPEALERARSERRPAVVDFRADWCLPCIEMERTTFVSPDVASRIPGFVMLRADVTEPSRENDGLLAQYGVLGVPTTIFFDEDGREHHRMIGYIDPTEFARLLEETRGAGRTKADADRATSASGKS
ncbi:MAG: protein-disulfide reductase DsbD family protein, partial [Candidatus Binatia bacterium]